MRRQCTIINVMHVPFTNQMLTEYGDISLTSNGQKRRR